MFFLINPFSSLSFRVIEGDKSCSVITGNQVARNAESTLQKCSALFQVEMALYQCLVPLQSLNTLEQRAVLIQGKLSDPRDSAEGRGEDDPAWNLNECILSSADTAISMESCLVPLSCLLSQRLPHPPLVLKEEMGSATLYKEHTRAAAREPPKQAVPPAPSIPSLSHLPKATLNQQNLGEKPIHP